MLASKTALLFSGITEQFGALSDLAIQGLPRRQIDQLKMHQIPNISRGFHHLIISGRALHTKRSITGVVRGSINESMLAHIVKQELLNFTAN